MFAESSTVSWVATPSGLVWADERGLWMRTRRAIPVLASTAAKAATQPGRIRPMSAGDLVLGAMRWAAAILGTSRRQIRILRRRQRHRARVGTTDGSIRRAAAVALNSSGIQITAPSSKRHRVIWRLI